MKNILITAANSDIAQALIDKLCNGKNSRDIHIFATYRKNLPSSCENFTPLFLDICDDESFLSIKNEIQNIKFDAVVNFAGIAITSPVTKIKSDDFMQQLNVSVVGLSRLLAFVYPYLNKNSRVINISSMSAFGIFPFISPYCAAKAAGDILLNAFEIETGIRTVSIRPGVVKTKFWQYCIDINQENFERFNGEYKEVGEFLLENAKINASRGVSSEDVARIIFKAIFKNRPKHLYLVGTDAYFASFSRFIPKNVLNFAIRKILDYRVRKFTDGKK